MTKYTIRDIKDYIDGNYIENIDELENDANFMYQVIRISKDKKMYYYCSDNIKENFNFVKSLITLFKDDVDFIITVANNFLKNDINLSKDYGMNIHILLLLKQYIPKEHDKYIFYSVRLENLTFKYLLALESSKENLTENEREKIGEGFYFVSSDFQQDELVMNYFALKIIDAIFNKNKINYNNLILTTFNNFAEYNNNKNTLFINLINRYDIFLADYIINHVNIIVKAYDNKLNEKNFIKYKEAYERKVINWMANDFFFYYDKYDDDFPANLGGYQIYLYLAKKNNLLNIIAKYDDIYNDVNELNINYSINEEELPFITRKRIKALEQIMFEGLKDFNYGNNIIENNMPRKLR